MYDLNRAERSSLFNIKLLISIMKIKRNNMQKKETWLIKS